MDNVNDKRKAWMWIFSIVFLADVILFFICTVNLFMRNNNKVLLYISLALEGITFIFAFVILSKKLGSTYIRAMATGAFIMVVPLLLINCVGLMNVDREDKKDVQQAALNKQAEELVSADGIKGYLYNKNNHLNLAKDITDSKDHRLLDYDGELAKFIIQQEFDDCMNSADTFEDTYSNLLYTHYDNYERVDIWFLKNYIGIKVFAQVEYHSGGMWGMHLGANAYATYCFKPGVSEQIKEIVDRKTEYVLQKHNELKQEALTTCTFNDALTVFENNRTSLKCVADFNDVFYDLQQIDDSTGSILDKLKEIDSSEISLLNDNPTLEESDGRIAYFARGKGYDIYYYPISYNFVVEKDYKDFFDDTKCVRRTYSVDETAGNKLEAFVKSLCKTTF